MMQSNSEMIKLQSEEHFMENVDGFSSIEEYVIRLFHLKAYEEASKYVSNKSVLDIGCNIGYGTDYISKFCNKIEGIDVSPEAIKIAKQKFSRSNIKFKLTDGVNLTYESNTFDIVVLIEVLEHIVDYEGFFKEVKRILKKNGTLILTTPNRMLRLENGQKPWNPFHFKEFGPTDLKDLLSKYFSRVIIKGLFAVDSLYEIEYKRVKRIKESYLLKDTHNSRIKSILKKVIKSKALERILNFVLNGSSIKRENNFNIEEYKKKYSTNDLFYRENNLEESLNLIAFCENDD